MIYDYLFIGATTLACAWAEEAERAGRRCAVLESAGLAGYDYAESWRADPVDRADCPDEARGLLDEMTARGAVNERGVLHLPALGAVLAGRLAQCGSDPFFFSRVTGIARDESGAFDVTAFSLGGAYHIRARRIVDTTADFATRLFWRQDAPECAATLSYAVQSEAPVDGVAPRPGCYGEAAYGDFPMLPGESVAGASRRLIDLWRAAEDGRAKIVHIAAYPSVRSSERARFFAADAAWVPSQAYGEPLEAWAAGASLARSAVWGAEAARPAVPEEIRDADVDVLVAGLGTAGAVAAVYAAARGLSVLGVENLSVPGGAATAGSVFNYYQGERKSGFYREIDRYQAACRDVLAAHPTNGGGSLAKMYALERALDEGGVRRVYNAMVTEALTDGERTAVGARYWAADGVHVVYAKQIIDATADGVLCRAAGCEMQKGRGADGLFMPFSSVVNLYDPASGVFGFSYTDCGVVDQYDARAFGRAIVNAASDRFHRLDCYRPEKDGRVYMGTAMLTGLREGERIAGEETARLSDALNGVYTDHPMFYMYSNIDGHSKDFAFEEPVLRDWFSIAGMWGWNLKIPLPAGILIPRGWNGLLAAGRHVSCDHSLSYGLRMMDDMARCAEAAVLLAEYSIRSGKSARTMPYEDLRAGMLRYGALKADDRPALERQPIAESFSAEGTPWLTDEGEIRAGLESEQCGYALWSARQRGAAFRETLAGWLKAGGERLAVNAALALSLNGFDDGADVLLRALDDRSGYIPSTSKMYVPPRVMAVMLACGRLGLRAAAERLTACFEHPESTDDMPIGRPYIFDNREDVRFQFRSHAFAALMELLERCPDLEASLLPRMRAVLADPAFEMSSTMMNDSRLRENLTDTARGIWNARYPGLRV